MLDLSAVEMALRRIDRAIGVCHLAERRAHRAGERARARVRRESLETRAAALREALLQAEDPVSAANRWDLRRLSAGDGGMGASG